MYRPRYSMHTLKQLRSYGVSMASVFALTGGLSWWRGEMTVTKTSVVLGVVACLWLATGLLAPSALRPLFHVWMWLAFVLSFVVSRVLLTVLFVVVLLPLSLVGRLAGKAPLDRERRHSYWKRYVRQAPREHFERLFGASRVGDSDG